MHLSGSNLKVPESHSSKDRLYFLPTRIITNEEKQSPTFDQLISLYKRTPVLVYEKMKTGQFLHIKRYKDRLVFVGRLNVLGILLLGVTGYWYVVGTKYHNYVLDGLLGIMAIAKLDDRMYKVTDWTQKKGRLLVYVTKETPKATMKTHEA